MKIMIVPMRTTLWNPNSNNNVYRVEDDKVRCLNCSDDQEDQMITRITQLPLLEWCFYYN
jgi:hypothetical protein